jgi:opacity protein-like surface antigen
VTADDIVASGATATGGFAWQAVGGITYSFAPRMTLDLGYRFFDLGTASMPLTLGDGTAAGTYTSAISASELLFVRIYEPFQRIWR